MMFHFEKIVAHNVLAVFALSLLAGLGPLRSPQAAFSGSFIGCSPATDLANSKVVFTMDNKPELYTFSFDGTLVKLPTAPFVKEGIKEIRSLVISSDYRALAFVATVKTPEGKEERNIYMLDLETFTLHHVALLPRTNSGSAITWLAWQNPPPDKGDDSDGKFLAYGVQKDGSTEVHVVDAMHGQHDTTIYNIVNIVKSKVSPQIPQISFVYFRNHKDLQGGIVFRDPRNGYISVLPLYQNSAGKFWTPGTDPIDDFLGLDDDEAQDLKGELKNATSAVVSPDGKYLAYVIGTTLYMRPLEAGGRAVVRAEGVDPGKPLNWSQNSQWLMFLKGGQMFVAGADATAVCIVGGSALAGHNIDAATWFPPDLPIP